MSAESANGFSDSLLLEGETVDEEEEPEEDEELVEPRFRYKRILSNLMLLMESDVASCFAIHEKLLVVGFQSGRICVFDHLGNINVDSSARNHKCAVSCVSVDDSASYFVSCANDFTVVVYGIGCAEYNQRLTLKNAAKQVAIAPDFSRSGSGQRLLAASQDLVLYERGVRAEFFSGRRRETVLYRGLEKDGLISALSWPHQSMVAFTNESGTRIYDMKLARCITLVQPIHKVDKFPTAKFPPKHIWLNQSTLAIGWANTVCVCGIVENTRRSSTTSELFESPKKYGQILHRFVLPHFSVAGISFTTRNSYGGDGDEKSAGGDEHEMPPPAICSPNASSRSLQALATLATSSNRNNNANDTGNNANKNGWRELIVFGIKRSGATDSSSIASSSLLMNGTKRSMGGEGEQTNIDQATTTRTTRTATIDQLFIANSSMDVEESTETASYSAQLLLIKPISVHEYFLEAEDTIEMRNVNAKALHRFTLCSLPNDDIYFILSPREAIEALPCSIDDRISWLLENGLYEEALESAIGNSKRLRQNSVLEVGKRLINHLIAGQKFERAAGYLPEVCAKHKEEWMFYMNEFERHHQVLKLVPVLPTKEPQLEPENYESILVAALHSRPKLFHALVTHWDADIYRAGSILSEVFKRITADNERKSRQKAQHQKEEDSSEMAQVLGEQDRIYLLRSLAALLLQCRKYDDAIKAYLLIRDPAIFGVIERHKLFPYVKDQIMELMGINQDLAIRLLLDHEDLMSHDKVVTLLRNHPKIQLAFLHRLQARGEGSAYSDLLVSLYADHDRPSLLPFLRKNEFYRLDQALAVCKRKDYIEEVVYLLGRSGDQLGALDLMVNKLLRLDMAIDFCVENDDPELWDRLIDSAIKRPEQISILLRRMGSIKVDSLKVIDKIPTHMQIPNLHQCLLQVLRDHEQQIELFKHSKEVASSDVLELFKERLRPRAIVVDQCGGSGQEMRCATCHKSLAGSANFLLMANGQLMHEQCFADKPAVVKTTFNTSSTSKEIF